MPAPAVGPAPARPTAAGDRISNGVAHCLDNPDRYQQDLANSTRHDDKVLLAVGPGRME